MRETPKIAYAFPQLRCTFDGRSIVPDIAVLLWEQIQFDDSSEPLGDVLIAPPTARTPTCRYDRLIDVAID